MRCTLMGMISFPSGQDRGEVIDMMWTQKEASLLEDLKTQEHICVEKYGKYAQQACDPALRQLFSQIQQIEQQHEQTVQQMIQGQIPQMNQQDQQAQQQPNQQPAYNVTPTPDKQADSYLCQDALGTEKHVSSVYDVSIFEFRSPQARQVLNHLQAEEQKHGQMIYDYMARNSMSA